MKCLITLAVVRPSVLPAGAVRSVRELEDELLSLAQNQPESVACFRFIMDGWDAPHRRFAEWCEANRPAAVRHLRKFVRRGYLVVRPTSTFAEGMVPVPSAAERTRIARMAGPEDYALLAFVQGIYDAIQFQQEAKCPLVLVARCVGLSRSDDEYSTQQSLRR